MDLKLNQFKATTFKAAVCDFYMFSQGIVKKDKFS